MRLMTAFLSSTVILVTACGKDAKDRLPDPPLYSPNGSLPGGVGTPQTIKLMPVGSPEVKRGEAIGYPVLAGRRPVKLVVDSAWQIDVNEVKCEQDVCTIAYVQTSMAQIMAPEIRYQVVDESGYFWFKGALSIDRPVPNFKPTPFIPAFGETVKLTLPLEDTYGDPLEFVPKIINPGASGGKLVSSTCSQESCTFEFLYDEFEKVPEISVILEGPAFRAQHLIRPEPESFTFNERTVTVSAEAPVVRLVHGVDYVSSWKRPASMISVKEHTGMIYPTFTCTKEECVSKISLLTGDFASFTYATGDSKNLGKLALTVKTPTE